MVLSGSLKEFILADVFNLLTQQKITGKLILTCDKREGGIVFKDGIIVGAECDEENLPNKLFNYLVDVKKAAPDNLSQLFNSNAGNLSVLCATAIERKLLTAQELKKFAESCVEDICCSLLTWDRGQYRFSSMRSVAAQSAGVVTISAENIIMEGMRRVDEWARMQEYINGDMIFVPAAKKTGDPTPGEIDPAGAPEEYILSLLNGSNSVKAIVKSSCLCEYKVYESINMLLQSQRITALHQKYTQSIQAALSRKDAEEASVIGKSFAGSLISAGIAAAIAAAVIICKFLLLPYLGVGSTEPSAAQADSVSVTAKTATAPNAVESATLLHQAVSGNAVTDSGTLINENLLTDKDYTK